MRICFLICITAIMLLGGCSKNNTVVNFSCNVAERYSTGNAANPINGNAVTYYNTAASTFQITMTGPNNQAVTIVWYNINSVASISNITAKTYNMPANPLPPFSVAGTYASQFSTTTYNTGTGRNLGGTLIVTSNTGGGGLISGTFAFNGLNYNNAYDTAYITNGIFTNVPVVNN